MKAKNGVDWSEWGFEVKGDCPKYRGIRSRTNRRSNKHISSTTSYKKWQRLLALDRGQECDKEAVLCDEWKEYENFLEWYNKNIYEIDGEEVGLSYRVFDMNNHYISPDTYIFAPKRIVDLCSGKGKIDRRTEKHKQAIEIVKNEYKDKIPKALYDKIIQTTEKEGVG